MPAEVLSVAPSATLTDKVRFLSAPGSYPQRPPTVEVQETHLSYVFLTPTDVYKMKKPAAHAYGDLRTLARLADVVANTGNATLVGKLEEHERKRDALQAELASGADRAKLKARLEAFTPATVHAMLEFFPLSPKAKPEAMRRTIQALVQHITLDPKPAARTVQVEYLFAVTPPRSAAEKFGGLARRELPQKAAKQALGFGVASPSRTELTRPTLTARRVLRMTRRERRAA